MKKHKRRPPDHLTAVWSRVPQRDLDAVEKRNPPWGWRSMVMRAACKRLAERLSQGASMDEVERVGAETGDWFVDQTRLDIWDRKS